MRQETKAKLDILERGEKRKRLFVIAALALCVACAAFVYGAPSTVRAEVPATVEHSQRGVDHWGQHFHHLSAKLGNGHSVQVNTVLVDRALKPGQQVMLTEVHGFWGNVFYQLQPQGVTKPGQDR